MISRRILTLPVALPLALIVVALLSPSARAQGRGSRGFAAGGGVRSGRRSGGRGRVLGGSAFLPAPYYHAYDDSGYWPPAAPAYPPSQAYQAFQGTYQDQAAVAPPAPPIEPLLMEERDGQWVRVLNGTELPTAAQAQAASAQAPKASATPEAPAQPPAKLPSAMIVFRDGHMEEVAKYMIQGNILYTSGDYWSTGSWTRKIRVADLDVPATLKINEQRGAKFDLPSGPGEIMVRF